MLDSPVCPVKFVRSVYPTAFWAIEVHSMCLPYAVLVQVWLQYTSNVTESFINVIVWHFIFRRVGRHYI